MLEVFHLIPDDLKKEVITKFGVHMITPQIKIHIHKLDANKLFPLLRQLPLRYREPLLLESCKGVNKNEKLGRQILQKFMENFDVLSDKVVVEFNYHLTLVAQQNLMEFLEGLKILTNDKKAKSMLIKPITIEKLIQYIDDSTSNENQDRIDVYLGISDLSSAENKIQFVKRILNIANKNKTNVMDTNLQFSLNQFNKLDTNNLELQDSKLVYDGLKDFVSQMTDEGHKTVVVQTILKIFPKLEDPQKKEFVEQHLAPIISSTGPGALTNIAESARTNDSGILQYDSILDNYISRLNQTGPIDERIWIFLIQSSPDEKKQKVADLIERMIRSANPSLFQLVANVFGRYNSSLTKELCEKICRACMDIGKSRPWQESLSLFDAVTASIDSCSEQIKNEFTDVVINWMNSADPTVRNHALLWLGKIYNKLSSQKKIFGVRQITLKLENLFSQGDANVADMVTFLVSNQENMETEDLTRLIDVLIGQISTARPPPIQSIALKNISKLKLGSRANIVLQSIFDLAKSTNDQGIKDACKTTLQELIGYFVKKNLADEVNKFYDEEVI
ncbi:MAG: hypothetical protein ACRD9Q_10980, partial [Nitrososphaeraceae archaeon]